MPYNSNKEGVFLFFIFIEITQIKFELQIFDKWSFKPDHLPVFTILFDVSIVIDRYPTVLWAQFE